MTLRLGALLEDESYALDLLDTADDASSLPVRGIHSSDYERPGAWLGENWILLTNGLRLVRRVDRQRALVRDLTDARATALGFGLGIAFKTPPPALVEEAQQLRLPIFTVPLSTSFAELMRRVHSDLASSDAREFHRLSTIQQYLLGSFDEHRPDVTIVNRLGALIDATVGILEPDGGVEICTGELPARQILAILRGRIAMVARLTIGDAQAVAMPIGGDEASPDRWLVACSRRLTGVALPAVQLAAPLLGALNRIEAGARRREQAERAQLVRTLVSDATPGQRQPAVARARAYGMGLTEPTRVILLRKQRSARTGGRLTADSLSPAVLAAFAENGARHLAATLADDVVLIVEAPQSRWPQLRRELLARLDPFVRVALGRPVTDPDQLPRSLRDARLAAERLALRSPSREVAWEDLDLGTMLIAEVGAARVAPRVNEILSVLESQPLLRETLIEYFACDFDVVKAARGLHVHPNTVRYRLTRIEELLGMSLRSAACISALHLALTADLSLRDDVAAV